VLETNAITESILHAANAKLCYQVKKIGKVFRAIAIMSHPIPNTAESHSVQIILPQKQLGRRSDMQVFLISSPRFIHYLLVFHLHISCVSNVGSNLHVCIPGMFSAVPTLIMSHQKANSSHSCQHKRRLIIQRRN
jgi:hypothetical protein